MTQTSDTAFAAAHLAVGIISGLVERGLINRADVEAMLDSARATATAQKHYGALSILENELTDLVNVVTNRPKPTLTLV